MCFEDKVNRFAAICEKIWKKKEQEREKFPTFGTHSHEESNEEKDKATLYIVHEPDYAPGMSRMRQADDADGGNDVYWVHVHASNCKP